MVTEESPLHCTRMLTNCYASQVSQLYVGCCGEVGHELCAGWR